MNINRKILSLVFYESILGIGIFIIWSIFRPYFIPDVFNIPYGVSLSVWALGWLSIWFLFIDKRIDKKKLNKVKYYGKRM